MKCLKKFLGNLSGIVLTPLLIYGHWSTGHPAFLYLIGFMICVIAIFLAIGLIGLLMTDVRVPAHGLSIIKLIWGGVVQASLLAYLLYISSFVLATIYIFVIVASWTIIKCIKK